MTQQTVAGGLLALSLLSACAAMPDKASIAQRTERWELLYDCICQTQPDPAQLRSTVGNESDFEFVQRLARIESAVARRPLVGGNRVLLLIDGPRTHEAQLAAIAKARHHIHLDIYLLTDDEVGHRYEKALIERARAGVQVRLIVDGFGGMGAGTAFRDNLQKAGIELREFNTVNLLKDPRLWRITRRSHRKILVVDGTVAYTGGINITDDYSGSFRNKDPDLRGWRDTHIQIEGPGVAEFQRLFLEYWRDLGDAAPEAPTFYPKLPARGDQFVRVVTDQGEDLLDQLLAPAGFVLRTLQGRNTNRDAPIYATYLAAIQESRRRVWITQAYFAPDDAFVDALIAAAERGVDVRLLMPGRTDIGLMLHAARHHYQRLLDAGIRLYEYQDAVMHAKTAVVDGVWATVGSSNLDYRSFIHNDEANAIIISRSFSAHMEQMFEDDLKSATQIDPIQWRERSLGKRLKEQMAAAIKFAL